MDINDYPVPLFSEDTEKEVGQPEGAKQFLAAIADADGLVISFAEHNGHYPAAYKNLFDWATRIERKVYADKPAVYLSASPGPGGAKSVLNAATQSAGFFGGNVKASVSVANFYEIFDEHSGTVSDPSIIKQLQQASDSLTD
nr:NADPH-dependent FMN reductase [Alteromonas sp. C1M14]